MLGLASGKSGTTHIDGMHVLLVVANGDDNLSKGAGVWVPVGGILLDDVVGFHLNEPGVYKG